MSEVTYYWDTRTPPSAWTNPDYIIDGLLSTFASTASDGASVAPQSTTCDGTDLGTITKVELRAYGYGDGDDRIDLSFSATAGPGAPEYQLTMPASKNWSSYVDVTSDPSVGGWTWAKVDNLYAETAYRLFVQFAKVGKGNTMYCAKVEIRVTYTPPGGYYHGLKVQGEGELALCDVGSHPLRIRKGGVTYGIELVAVDDPNASRIRIKTPAGIKAIRKYT